MPLAAFAESGFVVLGFEPDPGDAAGIAAGVVKVVCASPVRAKQPTVKKSVKSCFRIVKIFLCL